MKQGTGETLAYGMDPWISEVDDLDLDQKKTIQQILLQ